jgi:hypothetical protein
MHSEFYRWILCIFVENEPKTVQNNADILPSKIECKLHSAWGEYGELTMEIPGVAPL